MDAIVSRFDEHQRQRSCPLPGIRSADVLAPKPSSDRGLERRRSCWLCRVRCIRSLQRRLLGTAETHVL